MLFEIDNKYYVKVGKDFIEVEMVFKNNDIDLKATKNKLENNGSLNVREFNFLQEKESLIEEHKKQISEEHDNKSNSSNENNSSRSTGY